MQLRPVPCSILRGGTSKGIFVRAEALPSDPAVRDAVILDIFGSPDLRQIDGLGGADLLTSKLAIIGPPSRIDADVDYTFAQISVDRPQVDYTANCGNISAAVGPYAIYEGLVSATEPIARVRIHNTNTGTIILADVPIADGLPAVDGDYYIAGVPRPGARIDLDFSATAGSAGQGVLPTGQPQDTLQVDGLGALRVSIVDTANPIVFVYGPDLGLTGGETPAEISNDPETMGMLEAIRAAGAERLGFVADRRDALAVSPFRPFVTFVSEPADSRNFLDGSVVSGSELSFRARLLAMQMIHKAYAGTGAVCTAVAAKINGTIVNQVCRQGNFPNDVVRIGHPAGWMEVGVSVSQNSAAPVVERAVIGRHARKILDGTVYVRSSVWPNHSA